MQGDAGRIRVAIEIDDSVFAQHGFIDDEIAAAACGGLRQDHMGGIRHDVDRAAVPQHFLAARHVANRGQSRSCAATRN
jgi:hypothetical protein